MAVLVGCTSGEPAKGGGEALPDAPAPTVLRVELPAGLSVSVDGGEDETTPLADREVEAGTHALSVVTPCGDFSASVEVEGQTTTTVGVEAFEGLGVATLRLTAKSVEGKALPIVVQLGDWTAPAEKDGRYAVPACDLRLHVKSEGLGGFTEDLELKADQEVARDLVLAPGPDMVRIHGGTFIAGPTKAQRAKWEEDDGSWGFNHKVTMPTYDLDRTEVTTAQFHECRKSGACPWDTRLTFKTSMPQENEIHLCTTDPTDRERKPLTIKRGDHPMNCIAHWEAENYCKWVGKRLPTDMEWEFAARSRKTEYEHPWGNEIPNCMYTKRPYIKCGPGSHETQPVCSTPLGNSEQGLCDLDGNVTELVRFDQFSGRSAEAARLGITVAAGNDIVSRGGHFEWDGVPHYLDTFGRGWRERATVGFRCARDVEKGT